MMTQPDGPGGSPEKMKKYLDWCDRAFPVGRIGELDEVANLTVFLASREGNFMSGVQFPIDGAYSLTSHHHVPSDQ